MIHTTSNNYKVEKNITQTRRDPAIVSLRTIAMMLIVITHVAMVYDMTVLRYVTRVGTPLFFLMSGFLYGQRNIRNWGDFYLRRWKSLIIPIYLWLLVVSLVLGVGFSIYYDKSQYFTYLLNLYGIKHKFVTTSTSAELKSFVLLGDHIRGIEWLQQTWFMTYLMICLFSLPFIQWLRDVFTPKRWWLGGWTPIIVICGISHLLLTFYGVSVWNFTPFMMGYFVNKRLIPMTARSVMFLCLLGIVSIALREYVTSLSNETWVWDENGYYQIAHLMMVYSIMGITQFLFHLFPKWKGLPDVGNLTYCIFITHQLFYCSPFDILRTFENIKIVAIPLFFCATIISALFLQWMVKVTIRIMFPMKSKCSS